MAVTDLGQLTKEETAELFLNCLSFIPINVVCDIIVENMDDSDLEELYTRIGDALDEVDDSTEGAE